MFEKKITILIVDDSEIIRYSLKNFFSVYNFEVISCMNGLEGIQKTQEHKPDLIFLDLCMPNFDGMKMLRFIKSIDNLKNIPIIIISGITTKTNVLSAFSAGANRVISKPLRKDIIIRTIKELLGEDFLKISGNKNSVEQEDQEFLQELHKIFLEDYPTKKEKILASLENKDVSTLSSIAHELKGAGGSMGHQEISDICKDIEYSLKETSINWDNVQAKCEEFFSAAEQIEVSKTLVE